MHIRSEVRPTTEQTTTTDTWTAADAIARQSVRRRKKRCPIAWDGTRTDEDFEEEEETTMDRKFEIGEFHKMREKGAF